MSREPQAVGRFTTIAVVVLLCFGIAVPGHARRLPSSGEVVLSSWTWLAATWGRVVELWQGTPTALAPTSEKGVEIDPLGGR